MDIINILDNMTTVDYLECMVIERKLAQNPDAATLIVDEVWKTLWEVEYFRKMDDEEQVRTLRTMVVFTVFVLNKKMNKEKIKKN